MSPTTFAWSAQNLSRKQCRGCGRITEGWGHQFIASTGKRLRREVFALCGSCGGQCCGDCKPVVPCEFGITEGSPNACDPFDHSEPRGGESDDS